MAFVKNAIFELWNNTRKMPEKPHKHISCEHCGVRREGLFRNLLPSEVDELNSHKICNLFRKNQSIFLEGSFPRGVYCLNRGKVKVYTIGDEGKEQIIHVAKEGEILGFRAMFSGDPYKVSAATLEDSSICFIGKDDFLNMIDTNVALRNTIMKELSKELGDRAQFITNLAQKTVRERLAFTLILLEKVYGEDPINMSREDLANFVGTATETLIRLLKDFKEEGFIEVHTRKLTILKRDALIRIGGALK